MIGIRSFVAAALVVSGLTWNRAAQAAPPQDPAERIVHVTWKPAPTSDGSRQAVAVLVPDSGETADIARQVIAVEEAYRVAKLNKDVPALDRIMSPDFYGTNQNGNSRNKREALELWASFPIKSLVVERATVRVAGPTVTVAGEQTEVNDTGIDRMLFTRVYVPDGAGSWLLLSNTQFRNPQRTR